jgi:hypothetical protein
MNNVNNPTGSVTTQIGLHRPSTQKPTGPQKPTAGKQQRLDKAKNRSVAQSGSHNALRKPHHSWQNKAPTKAATNKPLLGQGGRSSSLLSLAGPERARPLESAKLEAALSKLVLADQALPQALEPGLATLPSSQVFAELDSLMSELAQLSVALQGSEPASPSAPPAGTLQGLDEKLDNLQGAVKDLAGPAGLIDAKLKTLVGTLNTQNGISKDQKDSLLRELRELDGFLIKGLVSHPDLTPTGKTQLAAVYADALLKAFKDSPSTEVKLAAIFNEEPGLKQEVSLQLAAKLAALERKAAVQQTDPATQAQQAKYAAGKQAEYEDAQRLAGKIVDFLDTHTDIKGAADLLKASQSQGADTRDGAKKLFIEKMRGSKTAFQQGISSLKTWLHDLTHRTPRRDSATKQADAVIKSTKLGR